MSGGALSFAVMTTFAPFAMERWQSTWEHRVRYNLSESGVHPLSVGELLTLADLDPHEIVATRLGYSQSNGSDELRTAVAELYDDAAPGNVVVTVGSAEANFLVCWTLLSRGDRVVVVSPTYMQTWGLAHNFGANVVCLPLHEERGWEPDPDEIRATITPGTKLVVVTNPNNPTGHILSDAARETLLQRVGEVGAWLLADEVYQGAERNGVTTPSCWSGYARAIVTNGLSKAYGLPGLRIGWVVAPDELAERLWSRHDYTVIAPSAVSDRLARAALGVRSRILERTRAILNENYPLLARFLSTFGPRFAWREPQAGAICYVRYAADRGALDLVERLRAERSVLLVPGDHFHMPHYLRFGYGNERAELSTALEELGAGLRAEFAD